MSKPLHTRIWSVGEFYKHRRHVVVTEEHFPGTVAACKAHIQEVLGSVPDFSDLSIVYRPQSPFFLEVEVASVSARGRFVFSDVLRELEQEEIFEALCTDVEVFIQASSR